jgi:hypothetical protein
MQSTALRPEDHALPQERTHTLLIMDRLLRERQAIWQQIHVEYRLETLIRDLVIAAAAAFACYGAVLGLSQGPLQALASLIKLPLLFLLTLGICLPTLYVSNVLCGGRLSPRQALALLLTAITGTSIFTLAFAPVTLFFLVTSHSYQLFILVNVAILTLTGSVGLVSLVNGARYLNALNAAEYAPRTTAAEDDQPPLAPPAPLIDGRVLSAWLALYGFVGAQLAWTLRPFFGIPGETFALFRPFEGSFAQSVIDMIAWLAR